MVNLLDSAFTETAVSGVKSDGVMIQPCGKSTAYLVIREIKNEIGTASTDPYNQGSLAYRKYWADEQREQ